MLDDKQIKLVKAIATNQFEEVKNRIHPREYHRLFTDIVATSPNFTINEWDSFTGNFTPLFIAVYHQHLLPIKELLDSGCDPHALIDVKIIDENQTVIMDFAGSVFDYALEHCCVEEIIPLLLDGKPLHGYHQMITPQGDILNLTANPAYLLALTHNKFAAALSFLLLDKIGIKEINEQIYFDGIITTPLQLTTFGQNPRQEEWLLQHGAKVNMTAALQGLIAKENLNPVLQYFPSFIPNGIWLDLKLLPLHIACALNDTASGALLQRHGAVLFGMFDDCIKNYLTWQNAINMQNEKALAPYRLRQEENTGSIMPYLLTMVILLFMAVMMYYNQRVIKNSINKFLYPNASRKNSNDTLFRAKSNKQGYSIIEILNTVATQAVDSDGEGYESGAENDSDEKSQLIQDSAQLSQRSTK